MKSIVKTSLKKLCAYLGYNIQKITPAHRTVSEHYKNSATGFLHYVNEAKKTGMDVNDWQEQTQGWPKALPILEKAVFPYIRENAIICELGPGTGRQARHLVKNEKVAEIHLVDHSPWMIHFLKEYFQDNPKVFFHLNNGYSLPFSHDSWVDIALSWGCFIAFKLSTFKSYALEFFRVLKPGGYCIINYIDIDTPEGWHHFETQGSNYGGNCYDYHTSQVVDKVFSFVGFEIITCYQIDYFSTLLVVRKPC